MGTLRELHPNPRFTKFLVEERIFENDPLVVVDVGARKGFEKHWDHYGDQIKLIGFEPNANSYEECVKNKSNNQTEYYPYALDRIEGERVFYITSYPAASGFYKPDFEIINRFGMEQSYQINDSIIVPTIDLDSFHERYDLPPIDFMKLDTEGSELDILKGAEKSLIDGVLGLSIETEFLRTHIDQPLFSDIDQYLRGIGFELYDLDLNRWSRKVLKSIDNSFGQLHFAQSLYLRKATNELENLKDGNKIWDYLRIIKMASIMELFNLPDCSIELIQKGQSLKFFESYDINSWIDFLTPELNNKHDSYNEYLHKMRVAKPSVDHYKKEKYRKIIRIIPWPLSIIVKRILLKIRDFINLFI